jgi:hypothetical protein
MMTMRKTGQNGRLSLNAPYAFLYVTERCNLKCRYCYFRDKKGRSLSLKTVMAFISLLQSKGQGPKKFILSGGEPLLVWPLTKKIISWLKKAVPGAEISIQTNGLLLDAPKIAFLKARGIDLEIGLDGGADVCTAWRYGMTEASFRRLLGALYACRKAGIGVNCNMTVHPSAVHAFFDNFTFLAGLPFGKIDITPAAFAVWKKQQQNTFIKNYAALVRLHGRRIYASDAVRLRPGRPWDVSLHPPGYVFAGDAFLCLPENLRKKYTLIRFTPRACIDEKNIAAFQTLYSRLMFKHPRRTYRDFILESFRIVNALAGSMQIRWKDLKVLFDAMTRLHPADKNRPGEKRRKTDVTPNRNKTIRESCCAGKAESKKKRAEGVKQLLFL